MTSMEKRLECQCDRKTDRQFLSDTDKLDGSYVQYEVQPLESGGLLVSLYIHDCEKTVVFTELLNLPEDAVGFADRLNKITTSISEIKDCLKNWILDQTAHNPEEDMDKLLGKTTETTKKKGGRPKGSKTVKKVDIATPDIALETLLDD